MQVHTPNEPPPLGGYDPLIDKEIQELAHRYWEKRGSPFGSPEVDWHRAVAEINRKYAAYPPWSEGGAI
jgi:hypothetical protein